MYESGMTEVQTEHVDIRIEDVDSTIFKHLLKFLYTGMVEPSAMNKELFTFPVEYQGEILMELCRTASNRRCGRHFKNFPALAECFFLVAY